MHQRDVVYDAGRRWRRDYTPELVGRELEIINDDLAATAIRLGGRDLGGLRHAAERALALGLNELTFFMRGSFPAAATPDGSGRWRPCALVRLGRLTSLLRAFLAEAATTTPRSYRGPVSYSRIGLSRLPGPRRSGASEHA